VAPDRSGLVAAHTVPKANRAKRRETLRSHRLFAPAPAAVILSLACSGIGIGDGSGSPTLFLFSSSLNFGQLLGHWRAQSVAICRSRKCGGSSRAHLARYYPTVQCLMRLKWHRRQRRSQLFSAESFFAKSFFAKSFFAKSFLAKSFLANSFND
jgi:hypothetical protein